MCVRVYSYIKCVCAYMSVYVLWHGMGMMHFVGNLAEKIYEVLKLQLENDLQVERCKFVFIA